MQIIKFKNNPVNLASNDVYLSIMIIFMIILCPYGTAKFCHAVEKQENTKINTAEVLYSSLNGDDALDYKIGPGDAVKIFVYENAEYNDVYRVGPDGKISLPIIGTIDARGKTREGLSEAIKSALTRYIASPLVTVIITEYNNNYVYLLGDIEKPGRYDIKGEMDMFAVLPLIGEILKKPGIQCDIIRGRGTIFQFDLTNHSSVLQDRSFINFRLKNSDILYFTIGNADIKRLYIVGNVKNPGLFFMNEKFDLQKLMDSSVDVIRKNTSTVKIIRASETGISQLDYNLKRPAHLNPKIMPGDIIYVPQENERKVKCFFKEIAPYLAVAAVGVEAGRIIYDEK